MSRSLFGEIAHQLSEIGGEIVHQTTGAPYSKKKSANRNPRNKSLEKELYKLKQSAFENKKAYEINKHILKSKGLI